MVMNMTMLLPIIITGFSVAFFHAAIPTHWLPFVMISRAQRWGTVKTLSITALAGGGHVLFTALLGFFIVWLGIKLDEKIGSLFPYIAGGVLICFGLYYFVRYFRGGRSHAHLGHGHSHDHGDSHQKGEIFCENPIKISANNFKSNKLGKSDRPAILSLLAMLTFSPCEGFVPIYVSGISFGWAGFLILTLILSVGTLLGMILFTWLSLLGMRKIELKIIEKYEGLFTGILLCALGGLVILLEH